MNPSAEWRHIEFARVISCKLCTKATDSNPLRDDGENVPQPGYIGSKYRNVRVLLVGQNPGTPKSLSAQDLPYTAALRALRDEPTTQRYKELRTVLRTFIPQWPVQNNHFPLIESGLTLDDIAYCNIVRCRTTGDGTPRELLSKQCLNEHFVRWLNLLNPKVVVFIGKWAWRQGSSAVGAKGIPCAFINRQRSLSTTERVENRAQVVALVRKHHG
ncbi:MAG: hypothetical protein EHM16_03080 [Betaproteobacteria bacterium]|nr:MAG: hypothetical protein EHM16_03080 [Betaproteobacteria bacterium]